MAEYIEDARDALIEGDRVLHPHFYDRSVPAPAFRDRFGNLITVGDWVVVGTRDGNVGGVLLSRVEKIEAREVSEYVPVGDTGAWERRPVIGALVQVRSLQWCNEHHSGPRAQSWHFKKAAWPNVGNMVAYNGKVPDVHE